MRPLVTHCFEGPNANGREAHTIALFASTFYDNLPRITYFAQDDCVPHRLLPLDNAAYAAVAASGQCGVLKLSALTPHAVVELVQRIEQARAAAIPVVVRQRRGVASGGARRVAR